MSGAMLSQLSFEYQYDRKKQIIGTMKSLGVSQEDITAASRVWTLATMRKLSNVIAEAIGKTDRDRAVKFSSARLDAREDPVKPEVLRDFLRDNHVTEKGVVELVDDYEYLFKTGEVRRPEVFPIGIQP
jgi:hypothetical protein